jgi:hypothetical protein
MIAHLRGGPRDRESIEIPLFRAQLFFPGEHGGSIVYVILGRDDAQRGALVYRYQPTSGS